MTFLDALRKYSPDQPRDDNGRWTDGGGGGSGSSGGGGGGSSSSPTTVSAPFSSQQKVILAGYKTSDFSHINSELRSGKSSSYASSVKTIDSAFNKSKLSSATTLYRGVQHVGLATRADELVGKTISPAGYQSTSMSAKEAINFAGFGKGAAVLKINAPSGAKAIHMDPFESGAARGENEVLLPRGSKMKITSVDRSGRVPIISVDLVP